MRKGSTVTRPSVDILARDLARLLHDLAAMYGELATMMSEKLEAIRAAETERISAITAQEATLASRVRERDGLRRQITQRMVEGLGLVEPPGARIRLSELADRLSEPRRSQLLSAAEGLKVVLQDLEKLRVVTTLVSQEMLKHLGAVLVSMTSGGPGNDVYGRTGQKQRSNVAHVFEAVG